MPDHGRPTRWPLATGLLLLAYAFPISLMVFNPTLMFERGWEQYVGTGLYFVALTLLTQRLIALRHESQTLARADEFLDKVLDRTAESTPTQVDASTVAVEQRNSDPSQQAEASRLESHKPRWLYSRLNMLSRSAATADVGLKELIELNREASSLDQEHAASRFTLPRYILYLLPVIGFIGTVEGISKALMNMSRVLPMIEDLDAFLSNLGLVTSSLQIAFDSTLLALFLSAWLMLVQTVLARRSESLLGQVDRWVTEVAMPALRAGRSTGEHTDGLGARSVEHLQSIESRLSGLLGATHQWDQWNRTLLDLIPALDRFAIGADGLGQLQDDLTAIRRWDATLERSAHSLQHLQMVAQTTQQCLRELQGGHERAAEASLAMTKQMSEAFDRSQQVTQQQVSKAMVGLQNALELLHVSIDQGNSLYRTIIQKMFNHSGDLDPGVGPDANPSQAA